MTSLTEIIEDAGHLFNLSSLCVDRPDSFISVQAYRSDHPELSMAGEPFPNTRRKIELKARMQESGRRLEPTPLTSHDVIVPLDELGGVQSIASWLDLAPTITPIIGSLLTMRAQSIYSENRFLNVSSAAEGLHRALTGKGRYMAVKDFDALRRSIRSELVPAEHVKWFNNIMAHANDFDLDRRLRELVGEIGELASYLIGGDIDSWVKAVKKARNNLTHLDESRNYFDGGDLYWLTESVFHVTRLCLLRRTGLQADRLDGIVRHIDRWNDVGRLEAAVKRIAGPPPKK